MVSVKYPDYYNNGTYKQNNKDINCNHSDHTFCNSVGWSNKDYYNGNIPNPNLKNPVKKDTVVVPCGGYTTIRFLADNPGYWVMHCHIENHHANGMQLLIKEGDSSVIKSIVKLDEINFCHKGYTEIVHHDGLPHHKTAYEINNVKDTAIIILLVVLIFLTFALVIMLGVTLILKYKKKVLVF